MRLAFVSFYSGLAQRGGETYVDALAQRLSKKNEVYVFQAGETKETKQYRIDQVKVVININHPHSRLPVTHILKRLFIDYFHLKELIFTLKLLPKLWKLKLDVVFPQNSGWEALLIRIFSTLTNTRVIIAGQSGPGWNDRVNLYTHPDIFIALTQSQADWAKTVTPWKNQKIVVIPNGVDQNLFSQKGEKRIIDLQKPIVLAVGAAIKSKRIPDTIKAVAKLKNTSLMVAGTGPNEQNEDELGKKLLGDRYKRLNVSHADMPSIYRASDVFTLCSDSSEAFGIVYLEALASGLPCVVTDDPSRREVLGCVGIFVKKPNDSVEYSQKINEALKIGKSNKFVEHAKIFSWNKISKDYEKLITDSLARED